MQRKEPTASLRLCVSLHSEKRLRKPPWTSKSDAVKLAPHLFSLSTLVGGDRKAGHPLQRVRHIYRCLLASLWVEPMSHKDVMYRLLVFFIKPFDAQDKGWLVGQKMGKKKKKTGTGYVARPRYRGVARYVHRAKRRTASGTHKRQVKKRTKTSTGRSITYYRPARQSGARRRPEFHAASWASGTGN